MCGRRYAERDPSHDPLRIPLLWRGMKSLRLAWSLLIGSRVATQAGLRVLPGFVLAPVLGNRESYIYVCATSSNGRKVFSTTDPAPPNRGPTA